VQAGEPLCELETSKANVDITSETEGILRRILISEGTAVPARTVLALIGMAADALPAIDPYYRVVRISSQSARVATDEPVESNNVIGREKGDVIASPRAKKLAAELGIDLASVTGTGPNGRIVEDDVRRALNA
jgi:pyruvate dehydrogenase E2 component (dihydrolipoamide acetyltransferase)